MGEWPSWDGKGKEKAGVKKPWVKVVKKDSGESEDGSKATAAAITMGFTEMMVVLKQQCATWLQL